ncbi:MAG: UDP-N-acetylmuramoyl-L-alanyl-D-glutamate--2,6-diaminopimelate ligase [Bacteroidetes bacterium]|nr:MAG: UDP-N-acetylmuramoyl-L-alanyl-D-glutamate--2,6-diaminopimelate ligase [Bacteroidota bacterium]PTM15154.1 MAG: UDP-N-acetylmuramoyl-L-alanyl-D-glutamate--2,6-diaminopimelate ligase [Bacteroidota bacterium]
MQVHQLIADLKAPLTWGDTNLLVKELVFDSRRVGAGCLFVAVRGTQTDGHQYIDQALSSGAVGIVAERAPTEQEQASAGCWVQVPRTSVALGQLAAAFFDHPSSQLKLVGVTGTNGKTTTATLLYQLFTGLGYQTGLLSTVENRIGTTLAAATHTTPDAVQLNRLLAEMVDAGCSYVFMEASSHAIDQDRIAGLDFAGGVFTNMSHDHLDYHGTFKAYIEAKKKFFDQLPKTAFALVNEDDKRGSVMVQNSAAKAYTYSLRSMADFRARVLENTPQGLHLEIDGQELFARLIGHFNAYNLLAVYGTAMLLQQNQAEVLRILSDLPGPAGRASYIRGAHGGITGVVDYAHTPDSVEKICGTLREMLSPGQRLLTVLGCGGDRDRTKRPLMAKAACDYSHEVILTSDNPRSEDPEAILDEMAKGVPPGKQAQVLRISDRRSAITTACRLARPGDLVLVAGKGHENYQEIKGVKHPFDDTAILREILAASA